MTVQYNVLLARVVRSAWSHQITMELAVQYELHAIKAWKLCDNSWAMRDLLWIAKHPFMDPTEEKPGVYPTRSFCESINDHVIGGCNLCCDVIRRAVSVPPSMAEILSGADRIKF